MGYKIDIIDKNGFYVSAIKGNPIIDSFREAVHKFCVCAEDAKDDEFIQLINTDHNNFVMATYSNGEYFFCDGFDFYEAQRPLKLKYGYSVELELYNFKAETHNFYCYDDAKKFYLKNIFARSHDKGHIIDNNTGEIYSHFEYDGSGNYHLYASDDFDTQD